MGSYIFYLAVSALPLIVQIIVVLVETDTSGNSSFNWHKVLVTEKPFWFVSILSFTTLLRLSDRVSTSEDFSIPKFYNVFRGWLFIVGIFAAVTGALVASAAYSGRNIAEDNIYTIAWIAIPMAIILGAGQLAIKDAVSGQVRN